jgi:hypothetical protein
MMSFGWRPNQSCYQPAVPIQAAQQPTCSVPMWFWVALGIATYAGLSKSK